MSEKVKTRPNKEVRGGEKRAKVKPKTWYNFFKDMDDTWYLYALLIGCIGLLLLVLIHRKLTHQKGRWGKKLNLKNIYVYKPQRSASENKFDSRGEIECRRFLETIFQMPFPKARPDFLQNPVTGYNLEIDCFNPTLRLGVEYNGQQHYSFSSFFHRNVEASTNQKYRDELKRRICEENGITLIEVPYTIKINDIGPYLHLKLNQLGYLM